MKYYETVEVPATTKESLKSTTCDLCGDDIKEGTYEVNEIEVRHRTGYNRPEGGSGEEIVVDMCGQCFSTKLIPWLESQGATPIKTEWDW